MLKTYFLVWHQWSRCSMINFYFEVITLKYYRFRFHYWLNWSYTPLSILKHSLWHTNIHLMYMPKQNWVGNRKLLVNALTLHQTLVYLLALLFVYFMFSFFLVFFVYLVWPIIILCIGQYTVFLYLQYL